MLTTLFAILSLGLLAARMTLRYTHMLQQSSYQNPSYVRWLRQNEQFPVRRWLPLVALPFVFWTPTPGKIALALLAWLCVWLNPNKYGKAAKKPLVYTPRVKRLLATSALLHALPLVLLPVSVSIALMLQSVVTGLSFFIPLLANKINAPIEKRISDGFVNEARRSLSQSPDLLIVGVTGSF